MKTTKLLVVVWTFVATAQILEAQNPGTIAVTGSGSASAPPSYVILRGTIRGQGDSGKEAAKKHAEARAKVEKAFADPIEKVSLRFRGEKPTATSLFEGPGAALLAGIGGGEDEKKIVITETVELRIDFENDMERNHIARKIGEMLDKATKAGVEVSRPVGQMAMAFGGISQGIAEFALASPAKVRRDAYKAALKDAQSRAQALAELANVKLGKVVSIEEIDPVANTESPYAALFAFAAVAERGETGEFSSDTNEMIKIKTRLRVIFQLID
ncbi:MAG: SIMPL domain-containing protein [Planctomycetes bacterium]|nr:SIMPL domain-containing protein [Planctomycetota bacterium]